jgi:WD40 repeat protein
VSGSWSGHLRIYGPDGTEHADQQVGSQPISAVATSPDASGFITAGYDKTIRLYNRVGTPITMCHVGSHAVCLTKISSQGVFAAGTEDGHVMAFKLMNVSLAPPVATASRMWTFFDANDGAFRKLGLLGGQFDEKTSIYCAKCAAKIPIDAYSLVVPCSLCGQEMRLNYWVALTSSPTIFRRWIGLALPITILSAAVACIAPRSWALAAVLLGIAIGFMVRAFVADRGDAGKRNRCQVCGNFNSKTRRRSSGGCPLCNDPVIS